MAYRSRLERLARTRSKSPSVVRIGSAVATLATRCEAMTVFSRHTIGPKPRRTRVQMIAAGVVLLVVVLLIAEAITDAVNDSPQVGRRALASWVAGVQPLLAASSAMGAAVHSIDAVNASTTRAALDAALATLTSTTASNLVDFDDLGIQAPSSGDRALVEHVLNSRALAVTELTQSVSLATTPSAATQSATASCVAAGRAIQAGDGAIGTLNGVFQTIRGVSHQQFRKWEAYGLTLGSGGCSNLVGTLRANHGLTLRRALKLVAISILPSPVQINGVPNPTTTTTTLPSHATTTTPTTTTTPPGLGTTTSTSSTTTTTTTTIPVTTTTLQIPPQSARSVLPPTNAITADVVVADTGDEAVPGVTVTVEVRGADGALMKRSGSAPQIAAGGSAYLTIGPVPLKSVRGTFVLEVEASAPGVAPSEQVVTLVRSS
jgi:hypothetical protein